MPSLSEPFSVPDPLAQAWDDMVRRNRRLQSGDDSGGSDLVARPDDPPPVVDDLVSRRGDPPAQWVNLSGQAAGGGADVAGSKRDAALAYGAGPILAQLAKGEGADGDAGYDATFGYGKYLPPGSAKPTQLTLDQWGQLADEMHRRGAPGAAIGKYQFMPATLKDVRSAMNLTGKEIATPELQDRMGREILKMAGYDRFLAGRISAATLQDNLAGRWSSVAGANGKTHYANQPRVGTSASQMQALLAQAQAETDSTTGSAGDLASRAWR